MAETDLNDGETARGLDEVFGSISTAECDLICTELIEQLDEDLRVVALLRLGGYQNTDIQELLQCSLRSVERRLHLIRAIWTEYNSGG